MTPQKIEEVLLNPDTIIQLATALKESQLQTARLMLESAEKDKKIAEMKPQVDYVEWILKSKGTMNINAIAKDYGMSAKSMNKILHELKIQYRQDEQWLLYEPYQDKGYTHSETIDFKRSDGRPDTRLHTKRTQAGRLFLYDLLKKNGIVPMIEREPTKKTKGA